MLSFLREQWAGNPKHDKDSSKTPSEGQKGQTDTEAHESSAKTGQSAGTYGIDSEITSEAQDQEYLTVATDHKSVRRSTVMLAVLFGIGMLCLWFMIKKSTPQTASASTAETDQSQIETAITKLVGIESEMFDRMDKIVNKFYEFSDVYQVKVNELVKNPFKLEVLLGKSSGENIDVDTEIQLRQQAGNFELLSIMQSEQGNCCMINDKILYEGDLIESFKVLQIGDDFVKLVSASIAKGPQSNNRSSEIQIILNLSE